MPQAMQKTYMRLSSIEIGSQESFWRFYIKDKELDFMLLWFSFTNTFNILLDFCTC